MNDLDLIAALRPDMPLAGADELARARERVTMTLAAEAAGSDAAGVHVTGPRARASVPRITAGRPRARRGRRLALAAAATAAVAAGVAIALALGTLVPSARTGAGGKRPPGARTVPGTRPARVTLPASLTAAQFLAQGAATLRHRHSTVPRPDQYVYTENVDPGAGSGGNKEWLSADGSRPGVVTHIRPGWTMALPACTVAQAESGGCFLAAGYLPGLPVNAGDVLAYLAKLNLASASAPAGQDTPNWLANDTGKAIGELMSTTYLLPGQQAAVFQMLAQTPGFQLIPNAEDALGRSGVGIYWAYQGGGVMIVFDPVTYQYLGFGTWPEGQGPAKSGRSVAAPDGSALATMAIVDAIPSPSRQSAALRALVREAIAWAKGQHPGQPQTVAATLTAYLRQVRHMSAAKIAKVLAELGFPPGPAPTS